MLQNVIDQIKKHYKDMPKEPCFGTFKSKRTQLRFMYYYVFSEGFFTIEDGRRVGFFASKEGEPFLKGAAKQIKFDNITLNNFDYYEGMVIDYIDDKLTWLDKKEALLNSINAEIIMKTEDSVANSEMKEGVIYISRLCLPFIVSKDGSFKDCFID